MDAVVCRSLNGLDGIEVTSVDPPALGAGQVRVKVFAAGVNFADLLIISGKYQVKPDLPFIPGLEVSGEIIEVGQQVSRLRVGQRVAALTGVGGYAQEVVCSQDTVIPIPDVMPFAEAAGFLVAYGTSHIGLVHRAGLREGETLLVHGASGGVGLTAVEIGALCGARVIGTVGSEEKKAVVLEKGAEAVINYRTEDFRTRTL
ncbi:MAG: NADPH:quinone oxidoreductase family protein, partial [Myxococcales bacterium]|nr:NADPH:quinone oxidoreductase family protein [Myxococcales bacterium]